jgi:hypothetical protein
MQAVHHSLGDHRSGRLPRYVVLLDGHPTVLATFRSAAWKCWAREEFLGSDEKQCAARLATVPGNERLCVLPAGWQRNPAILCAQPADHLWRGSRSGRCAGRPAFPGWSLVST